MKILMLVICDNVASHKHPREENKTHIQCGGERLGLGGSNRERKVDESARPNLAQLSGEHVASGRQPRSIAHDLMGTAGQMVG